MALKQFLLLAITFSLSSAVPRCNDTNPYQYSCYSVSDTKDVYSIATLKHVNPNKLADYNQVPVTYSFQENDYIIVPNDQCTPTPGQYECYTVQNGDSVYKIAISSDVSTIRSQQALKDANVEILYGESQKLYEGMQLRLPIKNRAETWETTFEKVSEYHIDVTYFAEKYNTTAQKIMQLNEDILFWNRSLNQGMIVNVPKPDAQVKAPVPCEENKYWSCYTTVENDSLWKIGAQKLVNDQLICEQNGIKNCSEIGIGQVIAIPIIPQCQDLPGVWECREVQYEIKSVNQWPLNMIVDFNYGMMKSNSKELAELVKSYNQDRLPKNGDSDYFFNNTQMRVPYEQCIPNFNYTCLPQGDPKLQLFFPDWEKNQQDWFNGMMLYSNWGQGWIPNCQLEGADKYNMIKVPLQTPPYATCNTYRPDEWCEDALYCPTCETQPGVHTCYKVGYGETIYSISQQFNVDWQALCQYNSMTNNCSCLQAEDTYIAIPVASKEMYLN